ncbi:hypothetical protein D3C81_1793940 [compost metagenome]
MLPEFKVTFSVSVAQVLQSDVAGREICFSLVLLMYRLKVCAPPEPFAYLRTAV